MPVPHHSVFTGWMPFLRPNQQCQSTDRVFNQGTGTDKDPLLVNISQYTNNTGTDNNSNNSPLNSPLFRTTLGASEYQYQILSSWLSIQAPACCPQPMLTTSSVAQYTDRTAFLTYVCRAYLLSM